MERYKHVVIFLPTCCSSGTKNLEYFCFKNELRIPGRCLHVLVKERGFSRIETIPLAEPSDTAVAYK